MKLGFILSLLGCLTIIQHVFSEPINDSRRRQLRLKSSEYRLRLKKTESERIDDTVTEFVKSSSNSNNSEGRTIVTGLRQEPNVRKYSGRCSKSQRKRKRTANIQDQTQGDARYGFRTNRVDALSRGERRAINRGNGRREADVRNERLQVTMRNSVVRRNSVDRSSSDRIRKEEHPDQLRKDRQRSLVRSRGNENRFERREVFVTRRSRTDRQIPQRKASELSNQLRDRISNNRIQKSLEQISRERRVDDRRHGLREVNRREENLERQLPIARRYGGHREQRRSINREERSIRSRQDSLLKTNTESDSQRMSLRNREQRSTIKNNLVYKLASRNQRRNGDLQHRLQSGTRLENSRKERSIERTNRYVDTGRKDQRDLGMERRSLDREHRTRDTELRLRRDKTDERYSEIRLLVSREDRTSRIIRQRRVKNQRSVSTLQGQRYIDLYRTVNRRERRTRIDEQDKNIERRVLDTRFNNVISNRLNMWISRSETRVESDRQRKHLSRTHQKDNDIQTSKTSRNIERRALDTRFNNVMSERSTRRVARLETRADGDRQPQHQTRSHQRYNGIHTSRSRRNIERRVLDTRFTNVMSDRSNRRIARLETRVDGDTQRQQQVRSHKRDNGIQTSRSSRNIERRVLDTRFNKVISDRSNKGITRLATRADGDRQRQLKSRTQERDNGIQTGRTDASTDVREKSTLREQTLLNADRRSNVRNQRSRIMDKTSRQKQNTKLTSSRDRIRLSVNSGENVEARKSSSLRRDHRGVERESRAAHRYQEFERRENLRIRLRNDRHVLRRNSNLERNNVSDRRVLDTLRRHRHLKHTDRYQFSRINNNRNFKTSMYASSRREQRSQDFSRSRSATRKVERRQSVASSRTVINNDHRVTRSTEDTKRISRISFSRRSVVPLNTNQKTLPVSLDFGCAGHLTANNKDVVTIRVNNDTISHPGEFSEDCLVSVPIQTTTRKSNLHTGQNPDRIDVMEFTRSKQANTHYAIDHDVALLTHSPNFKHLDHFTVRSVLQYSKPQQFDEATPNWLYDVDSLFRSLVISAIGYLVYTKPKSVY